MMLFLKPGLPCCCCLVISCNLEKSNVEFSLNRKFLKLEIPTRMDSWILKNLCSIWKIMRKRWNWHLRAWTKTMMVCLDIFYYFKCLKKLYIKCYLHLYSLSNWRQKIVNIEPLFIFLNGIKIIVYYRLKQYIITVFIIFQVCWSDALRSPDR